MRSRLLVVGLVLFVLLAFVATLFGIQNGGRTTQLSLDLGFVAWRLAEPVSIPVLVGGSFLLGFFVALALPRLARLAVRKRSSERSAALSDVGGSEDPWR